MKTRGSKSSARTGRKIDSAGKTARSGATGWEKAAYQAGVNAVSGFRPLTDPGEAPVLVQWERHMNETWGEWFRQRGFAGVPQKSYQLSCRRFMRGFCVTANISARSETLLPTAKTVSCVITAMNEALTLQLQLDELMRLPFEEVIVVVNGSTDESYNVARSHPIRATVVHYEPALGYDVGRAVGARMSRSDILLFLDGDMNIGMRLLIPFIYEVERGADIVLNPLTSLLPAFRRRDAASNIKHFLNVCLGRKDLQADSLTAVPHALSRRAVERLGAHVLAVPPLAQARAIRLGLAVAQAPAAVDVISYNRRRERNVGKGNPVEQLIIGDHLEALHECMAEAGARIRFPDIARKRERIAERREELDRKHQHRDHRA